MRAPGRPLHLIRRFFSSLGSRRPGPEDQLFVASLLSEPLARIFWAQPVPDQAHGVASARRVVREAPERTDLVRAALLHDVGKRHARLGIIGRSLASAIALVRLPVRGRYAVYLDHGRHGADDLAAAGAEFVAVAFARAHHGTRPPDVPEQDWGLLTRADAE